MPSAWFKRQLDKKVATRDAYKAAPKEKSAFEKIRRAETQYAVRLRKLASHVGEIVNRFPAGNVEAANTISKLLKDYAETIKPWANAVAKSMLAEVAYKDEQFWIKHTKGMGQALKDELASAPTGIVLRRLQEEQVKYITKIPLDAAQRVHDLTMEGLLDSSRAEEIAKEIRRQNKVSESYANLVARTEVGRVATNLTLARATHIGSEGYIWRTAGDSDVRPSHRRLEGTYHRWDTPPLCDSPNYHAHPGAIFNCRCWPEVVIPERYK